MEFLPGNSVELRGNALLHGLIDAGGIFRNPSPAFEQLCQSLGQLQVKAHRMSELLRQVEDALSEAGLNEPEQCLLDIVCAMARQNGSKVDIGLLLQQSGQPVNTVMSLLGALYMKRKLYMTVEPAARSQSTRTGQEDA